MDANSNPFQRLHSYWRMEYIEAPPPAGTEDNPFSTIPKATNDKEVLLLFRGEHNYIVLNKYPYNAGHLLVAPYKEVDQLSQLSPEEGLDFLNTIVKAQNILTKAIKPDGFNIGFNLGSAAGAGIPKHIHCHIVPRWNGDTNFMPVLTNTKVIPQSLEAMWERLHTFVN